jgi:predicted nucleic-acid-binding protein
MRAVDTNVLVRILTRGDAKQASAAERFVGNGAWLSHLALAEATWILDSVYDVGPAKITTAIEMLLNHKDLSVQDADVVAAALKRFRKRRAAGFSDCLLIEVARKAGHLPLGTFDRELGRLEGAQRL